jgi:hypothetical protein
LPEHPLAISKPVFAGMNQRRLDFNAALQPMLPLVPGQVPIEAGKQIGIQPDFDLAPGVSAYHSIGEEFTATEQKREFARRHLRLVRQDAIGKERFTVLRQMSLDKDRTEASVGKHSRCVFVFAQRIIAASEIGLCQNV